VGTVPEHQQKQAAVAGPSLRLPPAQEGDDEVAQRNVFALKSADRHFHALARCKKVLLY
jgi:hypothetical protein